jgi:hypothetical protein
MKIWICNDDKVCEIIKVVDSEEKASDFIEEDTKNHWTLNFEVE